MPEKIRIVMIDDEEELCQLVKANLEDKGEFQVATSTNPEQAENFIRQQNPDLILLDNIMPKRKGSEIVKTLKKDEATRRIPIIMISGKGEMVYNRKKGEFKWVPNNPVVRDRGPLPDVKGAEALAQAYGVDDYVSKPFTTDILVEVIQDVLKRKRKPTEEKPEEPSVGV